MTELNRKKWFETPDFDQDVQEISKTVLEKPNREVLETLFEFVKDTNNTRRRKDARTLFLVYIAKTNVNKSLKNEFLDMLTNFKKEFELFSEIIVEGSSSNSIEIIPYLLPTVNTFFQLICNGKNETTAVKVLNSVLPLYKNVIADFVKQLNTNFDETYNFKNEEFINAANTAMKQILWFLAKFPQLNLTEYLYDFLNFSQQILSFEKLGLDIKCKAGLLFVHCLGKLPEYELEHFTFKEEPILEVTNEPSSSSCWIRGKSFTFQNPDNSSAKVALYSALFNTLSLEKQLRVTLKNNENVYMLIFEEFLSSAEKPMKDNAEIVEVTRNLLLMSEKFERIPLENFDRIFTKSMSYLNAYCEYYMDAVAKNANLFMGHLIRTACLHYKKGTLKYVKHLLDTIDLKVSKRKIDFLTIMYICTYLGCSFLILKMPMLKTQIWELLQDESCYEDASTSYEILMKEHYKEIPFKSWLKTWINPAVEVLKIVREEKIHVYERIICRAFQINQDILKELFPNMGCRREWGVLLKCLSYARNSKGGTRPGTYDTSVYWWGLIEKNKLKMFGVQRDEMIRVSALKVITECNRSTEYFTEWEFSFMIDYYILNGSVQIPQIRKQILTLYKKALTRYSASLDCVKRQIESLRKKYAIKKAKTIEDWLDNFTKLQRCYSNFLNQFVILLIMNLSPDSNFYRRNSALELLSAIQPILETDVWNSLWKNHDVENLKLILMDSYEINKKLALDLLLKFDKKKYKFDDTAYYANYFGEALNHASDIKPSKSLSAAYMFQLCCNSPNFFKINEADKLSDCSEENEMSLNIIILLTSEMLSKLNADIFDDITGDEALKSPCYGMLLCLRYLMRNRNKTEWNTTYASAYKFIFTICQRFFRMLLPIVSTPAPEGYLPDYEEAIIRDDTAKSQKILVYAWRTIREITLLFVEFALQNDELVEHRILTTEECVEIGGYFVEIFTQAKHRGVFEQAYSAFIPLCESYWKSQNEQINTLPLEWLKAGMDLVRANDKLSPTRRSAGLPFMIMGIVSTDPSLDKAIFHKTISELIEMAADENEHRHNDSRTHSINILRFLFRHTKLGELVTSYIEKTCELTLKGLQSNDWNIRNSSTLLFAALMTRLFGVQRTQDSETVTVKNKMTIRVFTSRYPALFQLLIETLKKEYGSNCNSLVLHPVLLVFARLYPGHSEQYNNKVEEAKLFIRKCLASSSFEIRRLASRALVALINPSQVQEEIVTNFKRIGDRSIGNNECHGMLLEIWHAFNYRIDPNDPFDWSELITESVHVLERTGTSYSHHCVALYMNVLSFMFAKYENVKIDEEFLNKMLASISRLMKHPNANLTGRYDFEAALINLTITVLMVRNEPAHGLNVDFENYLTEGLTMKIYSLHFVLYTIVTYNERQMLKNDIPLFLFDELRVPDSVKNEIDTFTQRTKREFLISVHKSMVEYLRNEFVRMKRQLEQRRPIDNVESFVLNLLLLSRYPCVLTNLNNRNAIKTMHELLFFCSCNKSEVKSAVIGCLTVLLAQLDNDTLRRINYKRAIVLLRQSASPDAEIYQRLSVCRFLLQCRFLYYTSGWQTIKRCYVVHFLHMVMLLFEDECLMIRNEMSSLTDDENFISLDQTFNCGWQCSPDKARFDFIKYCYKILPRPAYISFLLSWSIRHFPDDVSNDLSDIFERSSLNTYAENIPIIQIAGKILIQLLWNVPYNLSYEDKSIFMQEQCQLVTTISLDAFYHYDIAFGKMLELRTKLCVLCLFRSILFYLEMKTVTVENFKRDFSMFFRERVLCILKKLSCKKDYDSVRRIFLLIYHPVLLENIEYD